MTPQPRDHRLRLSNVSREHKQGARVLAHLLTIAAVVAMALGPTAAVTAASDGSDAGGNGPSTTSEPDFGVSGPSVIEPVVANEGQPAEFAVYLDRAGVADATHVTLWLGGYTDQVQSANGGWTVVTDLDVDPASGVPGTRLEFSPVGDGARDTTLYFSIARVPKGPIWPLTLVITGNDGDELIYSDAAVGDKQPDLPALAVRVENGSTVPSTAGVVLESHSDDTAGASSDDTSSGGSSRFGIVVTIAAICGALGFTWAIRKDLADRRAAKERGER